MQGKSNVLLKHFHAWSDACEPSRTFHLALDQGKSSLLKHLHACALTARHGRALTARKDPASGKLRVLICGPEHGRLNRDLLRRKAHSLQPWLADAGVMHIEIARGARSCAMRGLGGDTGLNVQPRFCEWEARQERV